MLNGLLCRRACSLERRRQSRRSKEFWRPRRDLIRIVSVNKIGPRRGGRTVN
jgi:hypothetical protein